MSITFIDNIQKKFGGKIVFIPENCEYLCGGKALDVVECEIYCYADKLENQLVKTIYGVMLGGGSLSISGDSVKAHKTKLYCSGNLEKYAKSLASFCRMICGREEVKFES